MIITSEMAQPIVDQMIQVIDYNVNIMNHEGFIVASGDENRIHHIHQGALEAIELKRERIIYNSEFRDMAGTSIGVNVPIELNEDIIGVVGITGDPNKIYKFIHIIKITVETLLSQQVLIDQFKHKQTFLEEWIQNLLDIEYNNISLLESKANYLNFDHKQDCVFYIIEITNFNKSVYDFETLYKNEVRIIELFQLHYPYILFPTYIGKGLFVLIHPIKSSTSVERLVNIGEGMFQKLKAIDMDSYIGIGEINSGILGYRLSYQEALLSIEITKKISAERKVEHIKNLGILRLLNQVPPVDRQSYLNQFLDNRPKMPDELIQTLYKFLENNLNIKETSEDLHIHRNTLIYRLDKFKELWGLDPRKFTDAVELLLLYWSEKLK